jgi:ribonuclease E
MTVENCCSVCSRYLCRSCKGLHVAFYHSRSHVPIVLARDLDVDVEVIDLEEFSGEDAEEMRLEQLEEELQDEVDEDFVDDGEDSGFIVNDDDDDDDDDGDGEEEEASEESAVFTDSGDDNE